MVRVAFHALFFLGVEAVSLQTTSTQDHSIPQTYLPFCFLFVLFQLYADSSSYFYVSGIGSRILPAGLKATDQTQPVCPCKVRT